MDYDTLFFDLCWDVFAGEPSRASTFHAFDLAKEAGLPIIFDVIIALFLAFPAVAQMF